MNGSVLRIVAADRPPFVFYNGARTDFKFTGMLVDLLPTLLGYAQINPRLEYYNAPSNEGGTQLANGTWTGAAPLLLSEFYSRPTFHHHEYARSQGPGTAI